MNIPWLFQWGHAPLYKLVRDLVPADPADPTANRGRGRADRRREPDRPQRPGPAADGLDPLEDPPARGPGCGGRRVCVTLALGAILGPVGVSPGRDRRAGAGRLRDLGLAPAGLRDAPAPPCLQRGPARARSMAWSRSSCSGRTSTNRSSSGCSSWPRRSSAACSTASRPPTLVAGRIAGRLAETRRRRASSRSTGLAGALAVCLAA